MMELEDSRQQLRFISEDLQAIRSVALMADENRDWDTEGDIVRLIALAVGPIMRDVEEVIAKLRKWSLPLAAAAAALCAAFCIRYFGQVYADVPVNRSVLFTGFCWSGCLAVLGIMAEYGDFENGLTRWMGKRSFGLYIFHYLGISAFALYIGRKGLMPAPAVYFLTMVSGFAAGYILNAVISAIPFLRWAVLGIEKEKRDRHEERISGKMCRNYRSFGRNRI